MKVIVGLGNPGVRYARTRHNVGWMVVDQLAARQCGSLTKRLRRGLRVVAAYAECEQGGWQIRFMKPMTMMNHSGDALRPLKGRVSPEDVLLVCDDVNLPLGRLRLRPHGSAGGHQGLRSCLEVLETERVPRLRLGVGGGTGRADLTPHVLAEFSAAERPAAEAMVERAVEACGSWIEHGMTEAMQRYNPMGQVG